MKARWNIGIPTLMWALLFAYCPNAFAATAPHVIAGDFNGDGKTDIALTGPGHWFTLPVALSNGDGSFSVTNTPIAPDFPQWANPITPT